MPVRPSRRKRIVRVCWEHLAESPVRESFNSHLQESFDHVLGRRGTESEWAMFRASIVKVADRSRKVVGACRGGNSRTRWWTTAVRDAVKLKKESYRTFLPQRRSLRQKPGHGRSSVRPWRTTSGRLRRGSGPPYGVSGGGSSASSTLCMVETVRC